MSARKNMEGGKLDSKCFGLEMTNIASAHRSMATASQMLFLTTSALGNIVSPWAQEGEEDKMWMNTCSFPHKLLQS